MTLRRSAHVHTVSMSSQRSRQERTATIIVTVTAATTVIVTVTATVTATVIATATATVTVCAMPQAHPASGQNGYGKKKAKLPQTKCSHRTAPVQGDPEKPRLCSNNLLGRAKGTLNERFPEQDQHTAHKKRD